MKREERCKKILELLQNSSTPISGTKLAELFGVSRQVIVNDISLIRAMGHEITSTTQGYVTVNTSSPEECKRIFKVHHPNDKVEDELNIFVDYGATVKDVFINHHVYGIIRAELNIKSRRDVKDYIDSIKSGRSTFLSSTTNGYHYHTVYAGSKEDLDQIEDELWRKGYLAKPIEYEPHEFTKDIENRSNNK